MDYDFAILHCSYDHYLKSACEKGMRSSINEPTFMQIDTTINADTNSLILNAVAILKMLLFVYYRLSDYT